jgi:hypothetical protein
MKFPNLKLETWDKIGSVLLVLFAGWYILAWGAALAEGKKNTPYDLLVNIAAAVITALAVTVFVYYKFLRKIPDETRQKTDRLLNDRLGYETQNHHATMQSITLEAHHLSDEHRDIKNGVTELIVYQKTKKAQYENLSDQYKSIADSVSNLAGFGEIMEGLYQENQELRRIVREQSHELNQSREHGRNQHHGRSR